MTPDAFPPADPGGGDSPPVGAYVAGCTTGPRLVVDWRGQFRAAHELADDHDPDREAYLSLFAYPPPPYCRHFVRAGHSPAGYAGPAACRYLLFDVDRAGDPAAALADARALARHLLGRYGGKAEGGVGVYYSGRKGFHLLLDLLPGYAAGPGVPAACRRLSLALAGAAGVRVDPGCYDHQRLVRLANTRHPGTGLYKRYLGLDELFALDADRIRGLARHPAGFPVPECGEHIPRLEEDWAAAAAVPAPDRPTPTGPGSECPRPVVPRFVREFIGFGDVRDPGRAVTLFRAAAAALAEAGTPDPVVHGLLEEVALKTGLDAREVGKQIRDGIARGRRAGGAG